MHYHSMNISSQTYSVSYKKQRNFENAEMVSHRT
jgi:hypothetical protein